MSVAHGPRPPTRRHCEWAAAWSDPSCELPDVAVPGAFQHPTVTTGGVPMYNRITLAVVFLAGFVAGGPVFLLPLPEAQAEPPQGGRPPGRGAGGPTPKKNPLGGARFFPSVRQKFFPRVGPSDVEHALPEAFLPESPPAMFLQSRPELGDVSRGEVVSINNYYRLFADILTAVQLDGLRLLLTPFPQEEFNPTSDRKTAQPSLGVTCFDCHTNGHTSGQFHINPDTMPEQRRMRLDTVSLRGLYNQKIHGSKRSLRSVEDFTQFEQRTAYFNGDEIHAIKKGIIVLDRIQVSHMAQMQNMLDFPPTPKLNPTSGRLNRALATPSEARGEDVFFGKGQCASCHPAPFYLDNQLHDLHLERFIKNEPGDGPIKAFTLRGIKDSPP